MEHDINEALVHLHEAMLGLESACAVNLCHVSIAKLVGEMMVANSHLAEARNRVASIQERALREKRER